MATVTLAATRGGTHTPAPERTLAQRLDALRKANEVRSERAALKRELEAGRITARAVIQRAGDDPALATMKVYDVLLATPKWGRVKASNALKRCNVSPSKTLSGLSPRQRDELLRYLGPR